MRRASPTWLLLLFSGCVGVIDQDTPHDTPSSFGGGGGDDPSHGDTGPSDHTGGDTVPVDPSCPSFAVFCESFEQGIDLARWGYTGGSNAFSLDTGHAADGTTSLHLAWGKPYNHTGTRTLDTKTHIPAPNDRLYVRTYLRLGDLSLPGAHPFFITAMDAQKDEYLAFGSIINDFALMVVGNGLDNPQIWYEGPGYHASNDSGDDTPNSENGLLAGDWICVEMMVFGDHDGPGDTNHDNEEARVWINGTEIAAMRASDARWPPSAGEHWSPHYDGSTWRFGLESFGPNTAALDIWFDAIVIAHEPIGCL